jgi:bifunctional DNase/RNase
MDRMVECELSRIVINEDSDQQHIWIREKDGIRTFPIVIAIGEAMAIDRHVNARTMPRPLTHDLLKAVIESLGARVQRVEVTKLENQTFFAELILMGPDGEIAVDSRPSDAIATGVRFGAPLYVNDDVLQECSVNWTQ